MSDPIDAPWGLDLQGLNKQLGGRPVVADLSLQVRAGELLVLVGPSGSGKSTLLRLIAGLEAQDSGSIVVAGRDVGALPADQRNIAMVFQNYALFPHMTIDENLSFGMQARKQEKVVIRQRVQAVAEVLGLQDKLARYPRELSGGERQRVALGRAMLREPALFLLDEPLSNLDAQLRVQTRAEILRVHQRLKTTMVYVTHDQVEALSLGDRVGVLHQGRLLDLGTPTEVYQRPRTLFVARFIGSPPMNTVEVQAAPPMHVRRGDASFELPPALAARVGPVGRDWVLGVRPEHVCVQGSRWTLGQPVGAPLEALVQGAEFAGDQIYLHLAVQGTTLIARVEPEFAAQRGQTCWVWLRPEHLHLFDPATGQSLAAGESP